MGSSNKVFNQSFYKIICMGLMIEISCYFLSRSLDIPLLYDFGAMLITACCGLLTGFISVVFIGIARYFYLENEPYYLVLSFITLIITRIAIFKRGLQTWWVLLLYAVETGIVTGILDYVLHNSIGNGLGVSASTLIFGEHGGNQYLSVFYDIVISSVDKIFCFVLLYIVLSHLPESFTSKLFMMPAWDHNVRFTDSSYPFKKNKRLKSVRRISLARSMLYATMLISLVLGVSLFFLIRSVYRTSEIEHYGNIAKSYLDATAQLVGKNDVDELILPDANNSKRYIKLKERLSDFAEQSERIVKYVFIYQILPVDSRGYERVRVIFDSDKITGDPFGKVFPMTEDYYDEFRKSLADLDNHDELGPYVNDGKFGLILSYYRPVINSQKEKIFYVGIDLDMEKCMKELRALDTKIISIEFIILCLLLSAIYTTVLFKIIIPVRSLEIHTIKFKDSKKKVVDYNDPINSGDELEKLYQAIIENEAVIAQLAYRDEMTGVKNSTLYNVVVEDMNEKMKHSLLSFGLVMIDMNDLKLINDRYGHEKGSFAIKDMCRKVCTIFKHSPVYRIGGDEFLIILGSEDLANKDARMAELSEYQKPRNLASLKPWAEISLSAGLAVYDPTKDKTFKDVFNRADAEMYANKRKIKNAGAKTEREQALKAISEANARKLVVKESTGEESTVSETKPLDVKSTGKSVDISVEVTGETEAPKAKKADDFAEFSVKSNGNSEKAPTVDVVAQSSEKNAKVKIVSLTDKNI